MKFGEAWEDGPLNWVGVYMVAICGEIVVWVGRNFAKVLGLRLGWRKE